jgi:hypothetical protein
MKGPKLQRSSARRVASEKRLKKRLAYTEVGLPQTVERGGEVDEAVLRSVCQHAERSYDSEAATLRLATAVSLIDQQCVRSKLLSQRERREFACVKALIERNEITSRGLNPQPVRSMGDPLLHNRRRKFFAEFGDHGRRGEHATVERGQNVSMFDKDQISERTGVGDNDHSTGQSSGLLACSA